MLKLSVKHGSSSHEVEVPADATGETLQIALQGSTGVFARKQKLIFKGKVLDSSQLLSKQGVADGAKVMMLAAAGPAGGGGAAVQTKGQLAAMTVAQQKAADAKARVEAALASARGLPVPAALQQQGVTKAAAAGQRSGGGGCIPALADRQKNWQATGVVSLRDLGLAHIPADILATCPPSSSSSIKQDNINVTTAAIAASKSPTPMLSSSTSLQGKNLGTDSSTANPSQACQGDAGEGGASGAASEPSLQTANHSAITSPADVVMGGTTERNSGDNNDSRNDDHVSAPATSAWSSWGNAIRAMDISQNRIESIPSDISGLQSLTSLRARQNQITSAGVPWPSLVTLTALQTIDLSNNRITDLPGAWMLRLQQLKLLDLSCNALTALPTEMGALTALQALLLDHNQLTSLPEQVGACTSMTELSASHNQLSKVPDTVSSCKQLQRLQLSHNKITSVSAAVVQGCTSLWHLDLTANPITVDQLREVPGYAQLDARRKARADKQLDGRVLIDSSSAFTEGADSQEWAHWGLNKTNKQ